MESRFLCSRESEYAPVFPIGLGFPWLASGLRPGVAFAALLLISYPFVAQASQVLKPIPTPWEYGLCQTVNQTNFFRRECTIWDEHTWFLGPYCGERKNPRPWTDASQLLPKALAFGGITSAIWEGWLSQGETWGLWRCNADEPPAFVDGIEISNMARISGTFYASRTRSLACPDGYSLSGNDCAPDGVNPYKNYENCSLIVNGSNPIHAGTGVKLQTEYDIDGVGLLDFTRYYSSYEKDRLGELWRHNFEARLVVAEGLQQDAVIAYRPNHSRYS